MSYKKLAVATLAALSLQMSACAEEKGHSSTTHWGYEGHAGPAHWGSLSEDYAACSTGTQQSPVDITSSVKADLPPLKFNYSPISLIIENNGHTIKMSADKAGSLTIGEQVYHLLQFHTHSPSEGAVNGKRADMIVHLVHKSDQGELAVVAVFLEKGDTANSLIETLWKVMPKTQGKPQQHDIQIDINQLLPAEKHYYSLTGSLTTPPCSEGVKWVILKQPVSISAGQLTQYQTVYSHNARPLQPLNDRQVLSSN